MNYIVAMREYSFRILIFHVKWVCQMGMHEHAEHNSNLQIVVHATDDRASHHVVPNLVRE
jgi:hypothetical protein